MISVAFAVTGSVLLILIALPSGPLAWIGAALATAGLVGLAIYAAWAMLGGKM